MIKNRITDEQLTKAAGLVREAMLSAIPNSEERNHTFSMDFNRKMEAMRRRQERRKQYKQTAYRVAAAIVTVLVGFSIFCFLNTEVRAAIRGWAKELVGDLSYYWFQGEKAAELPYYELTYIPEGYEKIMDTALTNSRGMLFQRGENVKDCFTFDYGLTQEDFPIILDGSNIVHNIEEIIINGCRGEFHISTDILEENHGLIWVDEEKGVWFIILAFFDPEEIIKLAESVQIVAE